MRLVDLVRATETGTRDDGKTTAKENVQRRSEIFHSVELVRVPETGDLDDGRTTAEKLLQVIKTKAPVTVLGRLIGLVGRRSSRHAGNTDIDEVYPGIFVGNGLTAVNRDFLVRQKITHIINASEGTTIGNTRLGANYYRDTGIQYIGFEMTDCTLTNISQYFKPTVRFIDDAVSNNGRIFVHCRAGISRSVTLVVAYLMIRKDMTAADALRTVKLVRDIARPNDGFLIQLANLDNKLREKRAKEECYV